MPSTFAWVDFTDSDRRKMLDVLDLFSEHETRDEMGLGTIRDAFADYFFPGTSTIQTRARYILFIPWLFRDLERKNLSTSEYTAQARQVEIQLIYSLLEGRDIQGIIGQDAKKSLRRLPSDIYWAGLGSWGIRQFQGSRSQYFRYLPTFCRSKRNQVRNDDNEAIDQVKENWHMGIPKSPEGLMTKGQGMTQNFPVSNQAAGRAKLLLSRESSGESRLGLSLALPNTSEQSDSGKTDCSGT